MRPMTILSCIIITLQLAITNLRAQDLPKIKVGGANGFQITKYEITNKQYAFFLNKKQVPSSGILNGKKLVNVGDEALLVAFEDGEWKVKNGMENYPIVMVSYFGAVEFAKWSGGRLPKLSEWTYAASGADKSRHFEFAGSNSINSVAWYKDNSNGHLHPVGKKNANEIGIFDMSGNAWEWCLNDEIKDNNEFCLHMGGSWYAGQAAGRISARYGNSPTHFSNSVGFRMIFPLDPMVNIENYHGIPWNDKAQKIPGTLQCEFFDQGGEGVSFHDNDLVNSGSGGLNPEDGTFLNEFRINESVDISYTKSRKIDDNPYNIVQPAMDQLYVGWTEPGEWINYSIEATQTANYSLGLMYTASGDGSIELFLDGKPLSGVMGIPSTRNTLEATEWRQWHHWNRIDKITNLPVKKGKHVITLKIISNGNMNFDYLKFELIK
ncbi:MAG: carbohydrate-binding protein [Pedobacter sp.]|nr:MAG: carbohydrate-binding protein [Pedobacter sp.]